MISQITVQNFQSHKETVLDLHDGVNALIGLTGAGKSVVFKALDWVFRNRPLGEEYRSWWGGDTKVEIVLSDGQKVGRVRTDNDNYYYINKEKLRAFGNGPPPQSVLDILNLSEVNFQAQTDSSFLISNSSGEVARYLNKAARLDVIDQTLSNIASTLKREKSDRDRAKKDLEESTTELTKYDWLFEAEGVLLGLEEMDEEIDQWRFVRQGINQDLVNYDRGQGELSSLDRILSLESKVKELLSLDREIEEKNSEWEGLAHVVDQYEKTGKELEGLAKMEGCAEVVNRLLAISTGIDSLSDRRSALDTLIRDVDSGILAVGAAEKEERRLREEFNKVAPDICPLCDGTGRPQA